MKCFTDFIQNRVYVDTYFLRLHRPVTLIALLIAFIVATADLLISQSNFCYDYTKNKYILCEDILVTEVNPLLYIFEAIVAYLPFCIFSVGADKHPFKVLEEIQLISSDKSASEQLAKVMGRLDDFLASYRQTVQKKKRNSIMVCLLLQELFQIACFAVNVSLILYISATRFLAKVTPTNIWPDTVSLVIFWYFLISIVSIMHVVVRVGTVVFHKIKVFNKFYLGLSDDVVPSIGRLNYADWLFFDYVRYTTPEGFFKSALLRLNDEVGNEDLRLEV